ncbi:MAG: hypothetical protein IPK63_11530 [Candidatus Competibacteraceae bacterium]|nr:hypothetical protein [Candidatus Competibacteraceae bacterium]
MNSHDGRLYRVSSLTRTGFQTGYPNVVRDDRGAVCSERPNGRHGFYGFFDPALAGWFMTAASSSGSELQVAQNKYQKKNIMNKL